MTNRWQKEYQKLREFVARNQRIEITKNAMTIPEDAKVEFWNIFNKTRMVFIEEGSPSLINDAEILSQNYKKAVQEVKSLLGLDDISTTPGRHRFLNNPKDMSARLLFDPLLDLLKGKLDINTFEEKQPGNLETFFREVYQFGYSQWVLLSLVQLLEADEGLCVPSRHPSYKTVMRELRDNTQNIFPAEIDTPRQEAEIPPLQRLIKIEFTSGGMSILTVPNFIIHSPKLNKYLSVRTEFNVAMSTAANTSVKREWYPIESVLPLDNDIILIYVASEPEDITLVADVKKISRPDLILECRTQKDWYQMGGLKRERIYHNRLKPNLGTYIISRESVPVQVYKELETEQSSKGQGADIHILAVGFDQSKLEPIISKLENKEN